MSRRPAAVRTVAATDTRDLRSRVLRPAGVLPGDLPDAVHLAWVDAGGGGVLACAVLRAEPPVLALPGAGGPCWRLRGMAVEPARQGTGLGATVLDAVLAHIATAGGGLLWCNARTPAQNFYARAGFASAGDVWVDPEIGPHVVMWRRVEPASDRGRT